MRWTEHPLVAFACPCNPSLLRPLLSTDSGTRMWQMEPVAGFQESGCEFRSRGGPTGGLMREKGSHSRGWLPLGALLLGRERDAPFVAGQVVVERSAVQ